MDADTIRLILILLGIVLILALYLWERSREPDEEIDDDADPEDTDAPYGVRARKREPNLGRIDDDPDGPPHARRALDPDEDDEDVADMLARRPPSARRAAVQPATPPPLLIQLSVSARGEPFDGLDLVDAAESCGLHPGNMEIFHCLDEFEDGTRIYFSMANMVKPGTFPFDDMETFSTPGVMLFAQLEGDPEDMTVLDEMIATARKLASVLDGEVFDETRRPLTLKKEESLRQAILENERRWTRVKRW